jgi:hypothetical protein
MPNDSYFGEIPSGYHVLQCDEHGKQLIPDYINGVRNKEVGCPYCNRRRKEAEKDLIEQKLLDLVTKKKKVDDGE